MLARHTQIASISAWDALGEVFTMQTITNAEIDAICV